MSHLLLSIGRSSLLFLLFTAALSFSLAAQTHVEVTRNVNLRPDPSTQQHRIELLHPPESLELLDPNKTDGYYHVRTSDGKEGWVWANNVQLSPTETTVQPTGSIANTILSTWAKGTPTKTTFSGAEGPCKFDGDGGDPDEYTLKNRADSPSDGDLHDVSWNAIDALDFPGKTDHHYASTKRKSWNAAQLAIIAPFEGIPVRVVGYIAKIKPQTGNSEGTNCGNTQAGDVDFHLALVQNGGDPESSSIVIEWTPRFLKDHPNWTKNKLLPWQGSADPVRVTGWLMMDPSHPPHLGVYRSTLWEIHPITRFEVFKGGQFVDLDSLP